MKTLIAWGGYDESKPRVRLLLDALRRAQALGPEINIAAWRGVEDKSIVGPGRLLKALLTLLGAYPVAILRLLQAPRGGAVLLAYPGIPDIFAAVIPARLGGRKLVLDAFLPLHDTVVGDRKLLRERSPAARLLWHVERLGLLLADIILVDTDQHRDFFAAEFGIDPGRFVTVLVGAEPLFHEPPRTALPVPLPEEVPLVLFYGQLIPLHGLSTILEAVRLTAGERFGWLLVGRGQDEPLMRAALEQGGIDNMAWLPWVDYQALPALIARANLCLGIFGPSDKAARVIPNKMFQVLAAGKSMVTRSSPAVDPLANVYPETILTVPADDPQALAQAVRKALSQRLRPLPREAVAALGPEAGVTELLGRLSAG